MNALPGPPRPWGVSAVLGAVLVLGLWNGGRAVTLWRELDRLADLPIEPSPIWRLSMALGWMVLCGAVAIAMVRRSSWAGRAALGLLVAYVLIATGLQLAYATPPSPLQLLLYVIVILFTAVALSRPQAKRYFGLSTPQEVAEHRIP